MPDAVPSSSSPPARSILTAALRGVGQVMFQRHAAVGALFLLGLAVHSPPLALAGFLGALAGTTLAKLCQWPRADIDDGLYGYNAALVAIAAVAFYPFGWIGVGVAVIGSIVSTSLMHAMRRYGWKPYTFPFVATTWIAFAVVARSGGAATHPISIHHLPIDAFAQSFGQMMFLDNSLSGVIFLIALAVAARRAAALAALGALAALALAHALGWPGERIASGLYGYNAVLAAIAIGMLTPRLSAVIAAALLATAITHLMLQADLPALTFPFVLATWLVGAVVPAHPVQSRA
ncbi:MAG: urea transporter [Proteobacteria bacterium]|nr:urea transporter [Pseudomonadota bacterium]